MSYSFKALAFAVGVAGALCSCGSASDKDVIFKCDEFAVYTDSVVQGEFSAVAVSPLEITTNYRSPELSGASSRVNFRFSLNSRDNELLPGLSHTEIIGADTTIVYTFGEIANEPDANAKGSELPRDSKWTVRVDMRPILRSFAAKGYFATATGDTIFADDFKGIWIAGSVDPLSWDFENLYGKEDRRLTDRGDSIYQVTLTVNPTTHRPDDPTGWKISAPNPDFPLFEADQNLVSAMYNMSIADIASNIRPDDTYRAGKEWDGVWTRDVSYSIYLSLAYLDPQRAINSLRAKVENGRIIQDTGTGGAWPVSSDRVCWGIAAWEIYLVTGNREWLNEAFTVLTNTLKDDFQVVYDHRFGMMHGEQSYLDWREQTYPKWMQPKDIYESMCLGTNVVFARACDIVAMMVSELAVDDPEPDLEQIMWAGPEIAESINNHLWMPDMGYYSEYLYGGVYPIQSGSTENLGQALSVIMGVANEEMAKSLMEKTPRVVYGTPSVFPQLPDIKPYHNDAVWPFVQAFWNLAAAKTLNMEALNAGIASIYRAAAMFATNKELFVASNGDYRGTAVNSDSQLWSCAGNAAMPFRVYAGISFDRDGINFNPVVPAWLTGQKRITGLKYRNAVLDITVKGTGTEISRFSIDGKAANATHPSLPASIQGHHAVVIEMAGNELPKSEINITTQKWMPSTPVIDWTAPLQASISNHSDKEDYTVFANADRVLTTAQSQFSLNPTSDFTSIMVVPTRDDLGGFSPAPHLFIPQGALKIIEAESFGRGGTAKIADKKKAANFVELTRQPLTFDVTVEQGGDYFFDLRYANGNGPINTENMCAIRTLTIDGHTAGPIVMPQRGIGEWLSTGFSNMIAIKLHAGTNHLAIVFRPCDENMNGEVNTALIDYVRIIKAN